MECLPKTSPRTKPIEIWQSLTTQSVGFVSLLRNELVWDPCKEVQYLAEVEGESGFP
jgi:hypothetical protein